MQTFWILFGAIVVTSIIVFAAVKMGVRFKRANVKPGTIIEVGWNHGYAKDGRVKIEGGWYRIADVTVSSITIGERVA